MKAKHRRKPKSAENQLDQAKAAEDAMDLITIWTRPHAQPSEWFTGGVANSAKKWIMSVVSLEPA